MQVWEVVLTTRQTLRVRRKKVAVGIVQSLCRYEGSFIPPSILLPWSSEGSGFRWMGV